MKMKIIQYALAGAVAGIVVCMVRKKILDHKKGCLHRKNVEDFSYQQRKRFKDYYGEYTL